MVTSVAFNGPDELKRIGRSKAGKIFKVRRLAGNSKVSRGAGVAAGNVGGGARMAASQT
jgi:hypothetical protein